MAARPINGDMLLLARKRRRKTQKDLAEEAGVAQAAISRIENGTKDALSIEEVQAIARNLGFPVSFFYEQEPLYRKPMSIHGAAFRKKASVSVKDQDAIIALANHYVLHLRHLLEAVDLEPHYKLLQFEIVSEKSSVSENADAVSSPEEAAEKVRASWQLGNGPLIGLVNYIEATGVIVIEGDFGEADIDGVTLRPAGMKPVILLNQSRSADRKRFSLAHEYGHVIMHAFPYEAMEQEANRFASELLMPKAGILPDLKRGVTIPQLGRLKEKWRVSMASLIYRAKTLGAITDYQASSLYRQMNFHGIRKSEPFEFPHEPPQLPTQLIDIHLSELGYELLELSEGMKTLPNEFASMHGLKPPEDGDLASSKPKLKLIIGGGSN